MASMTDIAQSRSRARGPRRPADVPKRRTRRVVVWAVVTAVVLLLGAAAFFCYTAVTKAMSVRDALTPAVPLASALPAKVVAGDTDAAVSDATLIQERADAAVAETRSLTWDIAEKVPLLGSNFTAVREAAESVQEIADFAVESLPTLNLAAFQPVDGAVDLAAVHSLGDVVSRGAELFGRVDDRLSEAQQGALVPQVSSALDQLDVAVADVDDTLGSLAPILKVLPAALGEGQPRTYLLMFQGNSELRASGGNPASMALVTATEGRIEMTTQATSVQFANARPESISPLDPETENIYSDIIGRWIPNMTATPHFPTTVDIMRAWWADEGLPPFDDVISIDPVALSYMLKSTGPVPLTTGETLTSENAVSLLLNEVYFKYGDRTSWAPQDQFFAATAAAVFGALTSGVDDPVALLSALERATDEGRLKLWSSNPDITSLTAETKLAGVLPDTNDDRTVAGVYFNDTTGAKTDYYADAAITASSDQCTAEGAPTFSQTITFSNNITPAQAAGLPYYIVGKYYAAGTIATDVVVYSPVGATIESWEVTGAKGHRLMSEGTHLGRDVVRLSVVTTPQTEATIAVTMKGAEGLAADAYGDFDVWTTPMVRETPVTIDAPGCR
jgi:hypothetical protein